MTTRLAIIINPISGTGGRQNILADRVRLARALAEKHGVEAEILVSERAGHTPELAEHALASGITTVLAWGGDGTLNQVGGRLDRGEGTAGKLLTDPALFNRLNSTSERFDQLVARLNEGQGTVGQLLKDKQLYENMNGAVSDLRTLVAEIRKDPKKYLNVKISIF